MKLTLSTRIGVDSVAIATLESNMYLKEVEHEIDVILFQHKKLVLDTMLSHEIINGDTYMELMERNDI